MIIVVACALAMFLVGGGVVNARDIDDELRRAAQDWDLFHARVDACADADRMRADCVHGYCDELALRQADRACHAGDR